MNDPAGAPLRVLWIGPWGRPFARVFLDEIVRLGHRALLVTSESHYEKWDRPAGYELLVGGSPKRPGGWVDTARALAAVRRFRPDVVVSEEFHDVRFLSLLGRTPRLTLVHDDSPHDHTEEQAWYHRRVFLHVRDSADLLLTFSGFVARAVRARASSPVTTIGLPSEAGEHHVPPFCPAEGRRDVVLLGRLGPYKNLHATFGEWAAHVASADYRGDRLLVFGDGPTGPATVPPACEWNREHFQFADLMPVVARAKASLVYYTKATQSGVQVLSMQCGTTALVSDTGALPEYLPDGEKPVPLGVAGALSAELAAVADPDTAAERGRAARRRYEAVHHPSVTAGALVDVLRGMHAAATGSREAMR